MDPLCYIFKFPHDSYDTIIIGEGVPSGDRTEVTFNAGVQVLYYREGSYVGLHSPFEGNRKRNFNNPVTLKLNGLKMLVAVDYDAWRKFPDYQR